MTGAADVADVRPDHRRQSGSGGARGGLAKFGPYMLVAAAALVGAIVLATAASELIENHILHRALAQFLVVLAMIAICPLIAMITLASTATDRATHPFRRVAVSVIAVIAVLLAELGVLARIGLGTADSGHAALQQLAVACGILLGFAVRGAVRRADGKVSSWWDWGVLGVLVALWYLDRPGRDTAAPQTIVGAGYSRDWPDPLIELLLLAVLTRQLGRYLDASRRDDTLLSDMGPPLRALVGPAVATVLFAFTRDPAVLAFAVGSVAVWWSLERSARRVVPVQLWASVGAFFVLAPLLVLTEAHLYQYQKFTFDSVFRHVTGLWPYPTSTWKGALYWVAPVKTPAAHRAAYLVPASTGDGALMDAGLFLLAATLGLLVLWLARQVHGALARALATGLAAFVAIQCLMPFVSAVHLASSGLSVPLLSGSLVWGLTNAIALGTIVGLAQRPRRSGDSSRPDPGPNTAPRKGDPHAGL